MLFYRALVHGLVVLVAVNLLAAMATAGHLTGFNLVLGVIMTGHGLLFSFGAGFAANRQHAGLVLLAIVGILLAWPPTAEHLVMILVPVTAGGVVGVILQKLVKQATGVRKGYGRHQPVRRAQTDANNDRSADADPRLSQR